MIISHKYKYVFIQLNKSASTAIAKELVENYDGKPILWKHARYEDFMKIATPEEKKYFIFSGVRNPLDRAVSQYYFFKSGLAPKTKSNLEKYNYIKNANAGFKDYFLKYFSKSIQEEWKAKNFNKLDFIYRYENLQSDFSKILKMLKIKQKRPLPLFNKTLEKEDYKSCYAKEIQGTAKIIFAKLMKKWGYEFPKNWQDPDFFQNYFIRPMLYMKFAAQSIYHLFIDHPLIYKKYYRIRIKK